MGVVIPDMIEASCQRPGEWLVEGRIVKRRRPIWTIDGLGEWPTLTQAIEHIAGERGI